MDWRQQSRSRSRVPQAITGGMDWRAQSRSRSRAPNMRISMPSGPQGFQLPTYADIVETMASVSRAPQDVAIGSSSNVDLPSEPSMQATGAHSRQPSQAQLDMQSFERTLRQYIADGEATSTSGSTAQQAGASAPTQMTPSSSSLPFTQMPPVSPSRCANLSQSEQPGSASIPTPASSLPHTSVQQPQAIPNAGQNTSSDPSSLSSAENALLQSQKSISASVEAYLSSLVHQPSLIDLPPHRHIGSVPGLFNEQELKANHHADYGFLPKLVRKTSFDASYPAQLAHDQQKQSQKKRQHNQSQPTPTQPQMLAMPLPQAPQQSQDVSILTLFTSHFVLNAKCPNLVNRRLRKAG